MSLSFTTHTSAGACCNTSHLLSVTQYKLCANNHYYDLDQCSTHILKDTWPTVITSLHHWSTHYTRECTDLGTDSESVSISADQIGPNPVDLAPYSLSIPLVYIITYIIVFNSYPERFVALSWDVSSVHHRNHL